MSLETGKYYPYRKPNDTPMYIHRQSNHPPTIINSLPSAIGRRLTDISHDEDAFNAVAPAYNDALKASGYSETIAYTGQQGLARAAQRRRRTRERTITWYNPPYNKNVKTNIGERFLRLVTKHFPAGSKLHKIFNRGTVKISYSCTPNMATLIKRHNARVCTPAARESIKTQRCCNCRGGKETCPIEGECLARGVVYEASVTVEGGGPAKRYIGSTATTFKERYTNHKASLKHESKQHHTELSKFTWQLKRTGTAHQVKWRILRRAKEYSINSKRCDLCLTEKLMIATANKATLLNKRSEIASKCRHRLKHQLWNFAPM